MTRRRMAVKEQRSLSHDKKLSAFKYSPWYLWSLVTLENILVGEKIVRTINGFLLEELFCKTNKILRSANRALLSCSTRIHQCLSHRHQDGYYRNNSRVTIFTKWSTVSRLMHDFTFCGCPVALTRSSLVVMTDFSAINYVLGTCCTTVHSNFLSHS